MKGTQHRIARCTAKFVGDMQSTAALVTSSTPYRVACLQQKVRLACLLICPPKSGESACGVQVSPFQHSVPTQKLQRRARHTHQAVAQDSSEADTPTNSLFANNPAFAAALQSVAARQGDETLLSAPASAIPEEEYVTLVAFALHGACNANLCYA